MTFRTTLFRALAAADVALCNGSPVRAKLIEYDTGIDPFVSLADGTSLAINDDEIAIDEAGRAYTQHPDESGAVVWTFNGPPAAHGRLRATHAGRAAAPHSRMS